MLIRSDLNLCALLSALAIVGLSQRVSARDWTDPAAAPVAGPMSSYRVGTDGVVYIDEAAPSAMSVPAMSPSGQPWSGSVMANESLHTPWAPYQGSGAGGMLPPVYSHRTSVFAEYLYIRPRNAEVAYALPIDGPVAPILGNEVPVGATAVVDPGYASSFRVGASYACDCGNSIVGQYTRLRSSGNSASTVVAPLVLRSLVTHPLAANAATDTLDASATLNVNLDIADLDYRGLIYAQSPQTIGFIAGGQYAQLDQNFAAVFATPGVTAVGSAVDFSGGGIRAGLETERFWPCTGLSAYGTGILNVLVGTFDASYVQIDSFNQIEAFTSWSAARIVPVLDLEIGVAWLTLSRHLRISAGYRVSVWFNVVKTEDFIHAAQAHDFRDLDGTLTFDGLVARAEWNF
jgi:hypothetical protein